MAPAITAPLRCHWYCRLPPVATTPKLARSPIAARCASGMVTSAGAAVTVSSAALLPTMPAPLSTSTEISTPSSPATVAAVV